jgi:hypothetical protein
MCDNNCTPCLPELAHFDVTPDYRQSERLIDENIVLRKINECQAERIAELKNQIANLKKHLAALSKNSSTSSKPPSSDIIKGKEKKKGHQDGSKKRARKKGTRNMNANRFRLTK